MTFRVRLFFPDQENAWLLDVRFFQADPASAESALRTVVGELSAASHAVQIIKTDRMVIGHAKLLAERGLAPRLLQTVSQRLRECLEQEAEIKDGATRPILRGA
jgi:hypothetical protein